MTTYLDMRLRLDSKWKTFIHQNKMEEFSFNVAFFSMGLNSMRIEAIPSRSFSNSLRQLRLGKVEEIYYLPVLAWKVSLGDA